MPLKRSDEVKTSLLFFPIALMLSILLIVLHHRDTSYEYSWPIFWLWLVLFAASLMVALVHLPKAGAKGLASLIRQDAHIIAGVCMFAALLRFGLMPHYPYQALGDEIRDSGLNAFKILWGQSKDMFGLGDYNGYGYFIPLLAYPFIFLFGNSVLMYRVPAAIVGIISIVLTYFIARKQWGRTVGIAAAVMLSVSVFHLHYSRVELLVILDSLLGTIILLTYLSVPGTVYGSLLLGLMYGFCMHFYAGVRGLMAVTLVFIIARYATECLKGRAKIKVRELFLISGAFLIGLVVAMGPTIDTLIQVAGQNTGVSPPIHKQESFMKLDAKAKISYVADLYAKSFLVYTFVDTTDEHISYHAPLLPRPANYLFFAGLAFFGYAFIKKKDTAAGLMLALAFLFPVTNEVSVNHVGADHRMMSIFPVLFIITSAGLVTIARRVSGRHAKYFLILFLILYSAVQLRFYFIERPSDNLYQFHGGQDYKLQHIIETAQDEGAYSIFILDSPSHDYIFPQYVEKLRFFLMGRFYTILTVEEFIAAMQRNRSNDKAAFYAFEQDPELEGHRFREYAVQCPGDGLLPDYECPIDLRGMYTYYRVFPQ